MKKARVLAFLLLLVLLPLFVLAVKVKVSKVIDGDTVVLSDGTKLRYASINAPELNPKNGTPEPFALEAYLLNKELVEGKTVELVLASRKKDRFGRLLGYLVLENGTLVSEVLVQRGYAFACYYGGAERYLARLLEVQKRAILEKRGIFGLLKETAPYYIGNRRSYRFHRPDCRYAKRIKNPVRFKSVKEALLLGYCPARCCNPWRIY